MCMREVEAGGGGGGRGRRKGEQGGRGDLEEAGDVAVGHDQVKELQAV